ncbi:MAG: hypothetical protein WDO24_22230 [Pseudomonadota bacterium]
MRKTILAAIAVATLACSGGAFAQSQQGGYLGQNPGGHQLATTAAPSGRAGLAPGRLSRPQPRLDPEAAAGRRRSSRRDGDVAARLVQVVDPSRRAAGRPRSASNRSCLDTSPNNYAACRFALDKMHN